jgi:GNAT superfamily N-acetyltransferase
MERAEVETAIEWAAREGWNPGLDDAGLFYDTDPKGFFGGELDGRLIAALAGVAYGAGFGFIGLYLVLPEFRGRGYGLQLWKEVMHYRAAAMPDSMALSNSSTITGSQVLNSHTATSATKESGEANGHPGRLLFRLVRLTPIAWPPWIRSFFPLRAPASSAAGTRSPMPPPMP